MFFQSHQTHHSEQFQSETKHISKIRKKMISEDDIAEYMANKAHKRAMKVAKRMKSQTVYGYSNESNPFHDSNLNEKFVWRKKIEHDVYQGVPLDEFSVKAEKKRQRERISEFEKLKKRRDESAVQKARREEEFALLAKERERALELQHDLEKNDLGFEYKQSKIRSEIRLREGRAKPIDVLIRHVDPISGNHDFELIELREPPYMLFKGLNIKELEEVRDEIKKHLDFDNASPTNVIYWEAIMVVCEWEIAERLHRRVIGEETGLHTSIESDVMSVLQGKSYDELEAMQSEIESQMQCGAAKVVEYWEAVVKKLRIFKAKARLDEIHHAKMMKLIQDESSREIELAQDGEEEARAGSYSPQLMLHDDVENNDAIIDPEEDMAILERRRIAVLEEIGNFETNALNAMDRCQRRKPKYLNRVHTGYEWNKYNQTHYDHDNPPPKVVQGYKFEIFYPDLVDKSTAPVYTIEKDGDSANTCIIRFHAGLPYEDIKFRIVNKEWEYSRKKGFKCTFERGILRLHFNIKRYRYRR